MKKDKIKESIILSILGIITLINNILILILEEKENISIFLSILIGTNLVLTYILGIYSGIVIEKDRKIELKNGA